MEFLDIEYSLSSSPSGRMCFQLRLCDYVYLVHMALANSSECLSMLVAQLCKTHYRLSRTAYVGIVSKNKAENKVMLMLQKHCNMWVKCHKSICNTLTKVVQMKYSTLVLPRIGFQFAIDFSQGCAYLSLSAASINHS